MRPSTESFLVTFAFSQRSVHMDDDFYNRNVRSRVLISIFDIGRRMVGVVSAAVLVALLAIGCWFTFLRQFAKVPPTKSSQKLQGFKKENTKMRTKIVIRDLICFLYNFVGLAFTIWNQINVEISNVVRGPEIGVHKIIPSTLYLFKFFEQLRERMNRSQVLWVY